MRAIRELSVAIAGLQVAAGNPFPRLVAWIALAGQLVVPVLSVMEKYIIQGVNVVISAAVISGAVVLPIVRATEIQLFSSVELPRVKLRVFFVLISTTLIFVGIARVSPELSVLTYVIFALLPIKRVLGMGPVEQS